MGEPFRNKPICLIDRKHPDHPVENVHRKVRPFPWPYSDGYPPVVVHQGIVYADTGKYGDHETAPRLYIAAPDVTLDE